MREAKSNSNEIKSNLAQNQQSLISVPTNKTLNYVHEKNPQMKTQD